MRPSARLLALLFALCAPLFLTACDSDDDNVDARVPGTYAFEEFEFITSGSGVADVDILAALDQSESRLIVLNNGRFILEYQFKDAANDVLIDGTYEVDGTRVSFTFGENQTSLHRALLLPRTFRLSYSDNEGGILTGDFVGTAVPVGTFDPETFGEDAQLNGTYQIRLVSN